MKLDNFRNPPEENVIDEPTKIGSLAEIEAAKSIQEVQAALVIAKKFPRDEAQVYQKIMTACKRPALAVIALYSYPRGGQQVMGASIRLAEAIAQHWGNLQFGIKEITQENSVSEVEAFAWDLESNVQQRKIFQVRHLRSTKKGTYQLSDPRDIYELVANQGARRVRACLLGIIPSDVVEAAVEECKHTIVHGSDKPLADQVREMVAAYAKTGVTAVMLEKRLGHPTSECSPNEIVELRAIYQSIRDKAASIKDFFEFSKTQKNGNGND